MPISDIEFINRQESLKIIPPIKAGLTSPILSKPSFFRLSAFFSSKNPHEKVNNKDGM